MVVILPANIFAFSSPEWDREGGALVGRELFSPMSIVGPTHPHPIIATHHYFMQALSPQIFGPKIRCYPTPMESGFLAQCMLTPHTFCGVESPDVWQILNKAAQCPSPSPSRSVRGINKRMLLQLSCTRRGCIFRAQVENFDNKRLSCRSLRLACRSSIWRSNQLLLWNWLSASLRA